MTKVVSAVAIQTLKEALSSVYWYKNDLRSFLQNCLSDTYILSYADWGNYKRQIVSDIIDHLCSDQDKYLGDIRKLFHEVSRMESFPHLEHLEDGNKKISKAKSAVLELKRIVSIHDKAIKEEKSIEKRKKAELLKIEKNAAIRQKLFKIKENFIALLSSCSPQKRGFKLESILYDIFVLFDLDPKASFRNTGEQIDGAFSLKGTEFLFECKWQQKPSDIQDLDAFSGKIKRKLDNTLGLFLSMNGFSENGIIAHSTGRSVIILMTGADLMAILEERIDFINLILRKKRHAAQTGVVLLEFSDF